MLSLWKLCDWQVKTNGRAQKATKSNGSLREGGGHGVMCLGNGGEGRDNYALFFYFTIAPITLPTMCRQNKEGRVHWHAGPASG